MSSVKQCTRATLPASVIPERWANQVLFHTNPMPMLIIGSDGVVRAVNEAFASLTSQEAESVVGRTCCSAVCAEGSGTGACPVMKHRGDETAVQIETEIRAGDGSRIPAYLFAKPFHEDEECAGIVATIVDLTESRSYQHALAESQQAAIRAEQNKDQFLRNISHELRTPLNGIVGMSSLLGATELSDQQRKFLDTVITSADHLLGLVNELLDFTRIEAGRLTLDGTEFAIRDLAEELRLRHAWLARERGLVVQITVDEAVPHRIVADRVRLKQVLSHLMDNAVKFTQTGTVTLEISVAQPANKLMFTVSDTGIGIPDDDVQYIFESFRQLDGGYSRRQGGLGLGLAIVKKLVQLMKGSIQVDTGPDRGTSVQVMIPLSMAGPVDSDLGPNQEDHSVPKKTPWSVLIVEDEPINTLYLVELLQNRGCIVTSTRTGEEAIAEFGKQEFDVALIDIGLPTISGIETAARIRRIERERGGRQTPLIALTAHAFDEDREASLNAGMDSFVTKPFVEVELFATIASLVNG